MFLVFITQAENLILPDLEPQDYQTNSLSFELNSNSNLSSQSNSI